VLIRENKELPVKVIDVLREDTPARTGWHVTDLLRCPRVTYWAKIGEKPHFSKATLLRFARGRAHHGILEVFPLKEIVREKDGITGTIDMIGDRIVEIFTTSVSVNKIKTETDVVNVFSYKVDQLMAYCYMNGETSGDLLVFFIMGDYSRFAETPLGLTYVGIEPELKSWTFYFEESELKEVWDLILGRKKLIEECLRKKEVPEEKGEEWECNNCFYAHICPDAKRLDGIDIEKAKDTLRQLEWAVERLRKRESKV